MLLPLVALPDAVASAGDFEAPRLSLPCDRTLMATMAMMQRMTSSTLLVMTIVSMAVSTVDAPLGIALPRLAAAAAAQLSTHLPYQKARSLQTMQMLTLEPLAALATLARLQMTMRRKARSLPI